MSTVAFKPPVEATEVVVATDLVRRAAIISPIFLLVGAVGWALRGLCHRRWLSC